MNGQQEDEFWGEPDNGDVQDTDELYEHFRFSVDRGQELLRVDKYLMNFVQNATRNKVQNAIRAGNVLVNGSSVKPNYRVKPLDDIRVVLAHPPRDGAIIPEDIPLNIVYEDDHLIVVDKAAGMVVHPGHGNYSGTLVNALAYHCEQMPVQNGLERPGLVHRIDKDTSGLLVVAKTEYAMAALARQFFDHTVKRSYRALVWGNMENEKGTYTGNIGRNPSDRLQMTVFPDGTQGKHAVTHYRIIERFGYVTLVECRLETGRTHQIRAHFTFNGHPLFSDARYGGDRICKGTASGAYRSFVTRCMETMPRQALHAQQLGFIHPATCKYLEFNSPLPPDFIGAVEAWRKYSIGSAPSFK